MNDPKDFLNWAEISRYLCGNRSSLTKDRISDTQRPNVDIFVKHIKRALKEIKKP